MEEKILMETNSAKMHRIDLTKIQKQVAAKKVAKFCRECGEKYISDKHKFCGECGEKRE